MRSAMIFLKRESKIRKSSLLHSIVPILGALFLGGVTALTEDAQAHEEQLRAVLKGNKRPSVQQVQNLLDLGWKPSPLNYRKDLPIDTGKVDDGLQNNYPLWMKAIENGAPKMIADFERRYPGATWAFIGRDMSVLSDLFEAFYASIGQQDRVIRIGMSRPSLDGLTHERALEFMKQVGLDTDHLDRLEHAFVLVDAVSRNGGTQGRALLNPVFQHYKEGGGDPISLFSFVNFIGLQVATTQLNQTISATGYHHTMSYAKKDRSVASELFYPEDVYLYRDPTQTRDYVSTNEAGYAHFVQAWHGSYGPTGGHGRDLTLPEPGSPSSMAVRRAVLDFQAHNIILAKSAEFLRHVKAEAKGFGYRFPLSRPTYVPYPDREFNVSAGFSKTLVELQDALDDFSRYNFGRISDPNREKVYPHLTRILEGYFQGKEKDKRGKKSKSKSELRMEEFSRDFGQLTAMETYSNSVLKSLLNSEETLQLFLQPLVEETDIDAINRLVAMTSWSSEVIYSQALELIMDADWPKEVAMEFYQSIPNGLESPAYSASKAHFKKKYDDSGIKKKFGWLKKIGKKGRGGKNDDV